MRLRFVHLLSYPVLIALFACGEPGDSSSAKSISLIWSGEEGRFARQYLKARVPGAKLLEPEGIRIEPGRENTQSGLRSLLKVVQLKMDLAHSNLRNCKSTRDPETGRPYRRRYVKLDGENRAGKAIDTTRPFRLLYSPSHPDAVKLGPKRGYVQYPDFFARDEAGIIRENHAIYASIVNVLTEQRYLIPGTANYKRLVGKLDDLEKSCEF